MAAPIKHPPPRGTYGIVPNFRLSFPWFDRRAFPVLAGLVGALYVLEEVFRLREQQQSKPRRSVINTAVAATGFGVARLALLPAMVYAGAVAERRRFGLLQWLPPPKTLRYAIGFLLLDFGNYGWHVLTHRVPLLYRFHRVHHSDMDMDVTTGFRFHFGEQVFSVFYRGGVVALLGTPPDLVFGYEAVFEGCTAFHHSNLRLPARLEKALDYLMITPRLHGIHHSVARREFDSNYGVVFSYWDRLCGTHIDDVAQEDITIGLPAWRDPAELTVKKLHTMPLRPVEAWARNPIGTI